MAESPGPRRLVPEQRHLQAQAGEKLQRCRDLVGQLNLPMKLVDCEHLLGGERIIFYFMAEGRVDFRDLVKTLSHEFQTRIEMRQIGARDEARLLGDVEGCGQQICCRRFLKFLKPVNMRMAKMQKATLDPAKISGYCGRLKCCLRYEYDQYRQLSRQLPREGTTVECPVGPGTVVDRHVLAQRVVVRLEDNRVTEYDVDEIKKAPRRNNR